MSNPTSTWCWNDGRRVPVVDHGKRSALRRQADRVGAFLDVVDWEVEVEGGEKFFSKRPS